MNSGRGKRQARNSVDVLHGLMSFHKGLLEDKARNRAFHAALAARVRPASSVLDIGAGTGIWAVAAARLGARQVVAVEKEAFLIPIIEELAKANGVDARIDVIHGDARELRLGRRFDVVVSETVGNRGFEEGIIPILARARSRFLRPGGVLIPESIALVAAPARVRGSSASGLPLCFSGLDALAVHFPRSRAAWRVRPLAPPRELIRVDLRRAPGAYVLPQMSARWKVESAHRIQAIAVWTRMQLAPGVRLESLETSSWMPTLYGMERLPRRSGVLEFSLEPTGKNPRWEVRLAGPGWGHAASYSPLFAYGWARPRIRRG